MVSVVANAMAFQAQQIARGWLAYDLTRSPLALGIVLVSMGIPMLLLGPWGGVVADRANRRQVMVVAQLTSATVAFSIGLLVSLGAIAFWHLVLAGVIVGVANGLQMPSRLAFVYDLVGQEHITNAVALNSGTVNAMRLVAPALAGVLIGAVGIDAVYFIVAAGYATSVAAILWLVHEPGRGRARRPASASPAGQLREGIAYLFRHRVVLWLLVVAFVTTFVGLPFRNLMPAFAVEALNQGPQGYGLLMSTMGVGAVLGSVIIASLGNLRGKGRLLLGAALAWGLGLVAFSQSTSLAQALPLLLILGSVSTGFNTLNNVLIQTTVRDEFRGRMLSFYILTFGLNSVGTLPLGALAEAITTSQALLVSGLLLGVVITLTTLWRRDLRRLE